MDRKEAGVNRKQWIIAGILITVFLVVGIILLLNNNPDEPADTGQGTPVPALVYCSEEQVRPCVVSFSLDADGNMLVNILLPELSFPNFHLKIIRGENEADYRCQRVTTTLDSAYCIGEKMPPGELLHLKLISTRDETLLAEGDLSIIGLALPTVAVVSPTFGTASTELATNVSTATPTRTQIPTPSRRTPTPTPPSYPGPSYPNPSYP